MPRVNTQIYEQLKVLGYVDQFNEALRTFLTDEGYSAALNEAMHDWLGSVGYTGQYSERLDAWAEEGYPYMDSGSGIWILTDGTWDNTGSWDDTDVWNDGA